jgi:hypothetical protein
MMSEIDVDGLRERVFRGHVAHHPDDGAWLGLEVHALADETEHGLGDRLAFHVGVVSALRGIEVGSRDDEAALDVSAIRRLSRSLAQDLEDGTYAASLEPSAGPHALVAHLHRHAGSKADTSALEHVLAGVPRAYEARLDRLRDRARAGHMQDARIVATFCDEVLPGAARYFEALGAEAVGARGRGEDIVGLAERAARAAREHEALLRTLPSREGRGRLDREGYARRVYDQWERGAAWLDDLERAATDELARLTGRFVSAAAVVSRDEASGTPGTIAEATRVALSAWGTKPTKASEIVPLYERATERARSFCRARRIVREPEGYALSFRELFPGLLPGASITNLPAPLLRRGSKGHVLVSLDPSAHSIPGAANLAVHEGYPGHYLQSLAWQEAFADAPFPLRFFHTSDDVAMKSRYFGTMLAIEGFAVHAEERMLEEGLYEPREALLAVVSQLIRAARVLVDLRVHGGREGLDAIVADYAAWTGMPIGWCEGQVLRSLRIPLQVVSYFAGAREVEALRREAMTREGPAFSSEAFYDRLFRLGPVSPLPPR